MVFPRTSWLWYHQEMSCLLLIGFFPSFSRWICILLCWWWKWKCYFCHVLLGESTQGEEKTEISKFSPPLWQKCVCYLPRYWRTLKVRPCVSSITREGNNTTALSYSTVYRWFCTDSPCKLCELHSCTKKKKRGLSQRKEIKFLPFCMFSLKKEKKNSF